MSKEITTEQYYKITFPDGSTYYGRTKHHIYERWGNHLQTARLNTHRNKHIQTVYDEYGYDDWVFEILFVKVYSKDQHSICENTLIHDDSKALNIRVKYTSKQRKLRDEEIKQQYRERYRIKRSNMTQEEIDKRNKISNERLKKRLKNRTPEEIEFKKQYDREYQQRKRDNKVVDNKEV